MFIKKAKTFLLTCVLAFAMCSMFTAKTFGQQIQILRVDSSADAGGDGSSWTAAYNTLWAALDRAHDNPNPVHWEIWVAKGTYTPMGQDTPFIIDGKSGEAGVDRIVLLGGYAGKDAPDPNLRDPKFYLTILSGDILGANSQYGIDSDFGNRNVNPDNWHDLTRADNARTVLLVTDSGRGNRIEGFTIEGGAGGLRSLANPYNFGGGMNISASAIDIVNCTFRFNSAGAVADPEENPPFGRFGEGGAALVSGSWKISEGIYDYTRFINCIFHDNLASRGGALALVDGSVAIAPTQVKVLNSLFYDNQALVITNIVIELFEGKGGESTIVLRKSIFRSELAFKSHHIGSTSILPVH